MVIFVDQKNKYVICIILWFLETLPVFGIREYI